MAKAKGSANKSGNSGKSKDVNNYSHGQDHPLRPDIGTEPLFKKKKPPATYRYDSSLAPALDWDDQPARLKAEQLIQRILEADDLAQAQGAARELKALGRPFLNWTGKAERLSFDVPTLPLFVHERLSTRAIVETLKGHQAKPNQLDLFSDPQWSITDQILRAYEYHDRWVNRMILGDSLVVMNSLMQYEGMAGQVQMIYMDPPYGVKFGSNFQPFVRKRDVKHNDDDDLTREPEMVQAYRDTWELGLHSYLTYLRDRLLLARELLADSGSVFVQISDENVHHVRELMDEVFGEENFVCIITVQKSPYATSNTLPVVSDFLIWYARDKSKIKYCQLFKQKADLDSLDLYRLALSPDGKNYRPLTKEEQQTGVLSEGWKRYRLVSLVSQGASGNPKSFIFQGKEYTPPPNSHWKVTTDGLENVARANRIQSTKNTIQFRSLIEDFPIAITHNLWTDTITGSFLDEKLYVVQTNPKIIERCLLMTTDPGDLVIDLTCGSGTTAYVAEQWGRRWITCDVSRVPLALARQRLLTATFPWYELKNGKSPANGFVYQRKQNSKGEEIGGIVPHITLKSIANNEPPDMETLVDRPETDSSIVRVCSPFTIEGTIPPPADMALEPTTPEPPETEPDFSFTGKMLEVLRQSPILRLPQNQTVTFQNLRQLTKSQHLTATATVDGQPVVFIFGPENGAIAEKSVYEAAQEAKNQYQHLYVIGFAIVAKARQFVEHCHETIGIPATYIQATPDLLMGDLLKNMRSSQIFSVCGLPDITITPLANNEYTVELLGLDVFDPVTMQASHQKGKDIPAWFLDTDYNGLCFYVRQAFFPRTSAWDSLKKALKGSYEDSVWDHLSGTTSAPFTPGENREIAVKVIDDRGNELLVVKELPK